jgi:flagellar motor switch protein FliG
VSTALSMPQAPQGGAPALRAAGLTRRQKAAIIVRLALAEGAQISLTDLPGAVQSELIHQMASLRHVDHETMLAVVQEFTSAFNGNGLSFPGALQETLDLMDGCISKDTSNRIRRQAGLAMHADPWARISGLDVEMLLPLLDGESVEVGAVVLSKLKVSKAAELLGQMPGERARRIAYAVSLTSEIAPAVVLKIGHSIAEQLDTQPEREFDTGPVERVGAILNFSPAATREDVLDGLEQADASFASQVRKAIFTFANIPERIDPRDITKITREVEPAKLVMALAAATGEDEKVAEFILTNMSKRMAESLREEMTELGEVKQKDGEAAMTALVIAIRELADSGDIFLIAEEDEE